MIKRVTLKRFKRFESKTFALEPKGLTICAGQNNSGKSSLLHALAVWSFGVMIIRQFKGEDALMEGYRGQGSGISKDDFTAVNVPDLRHLWYDLKSQIPGEGYSMNIGVVWEREGIEKNLTISFSLVQDRLYTKATGSNLVGGDKPPRIVYLPPVAGVDAREEYATPAKRMALLGRGLAGSVLRNILLDLERRNREERERLKGDKKKISSKDLSNLRKNDPWERLNGLMKETFLFSLQCDPFNQAFHSVIKVYAVPKKRQGQEWITAGAKRDLMVEGSGALQWLTVFAFALSPETDVLLLDEPDAHLHAKLKVEMIERLDEISMKGNGPQVLLATHASEILKRYRIDRIIDFGMKNPTYISNDGQRARLIAGLGDHYIPLIDKAIESRCILFVEGERDERILKSVAHKCGLKWPQNIAIHKMSAAHKDRLKFYTNLLNAIDGLKAISICDRDNRDIGIVDKNNLCDKQVKTKEFPGFRARTWRRREIENYALIPEALERVAGEEAKSWWRDRGFHWPEGRETISKDVFLNIDIKNDIEKFLRSKKLTIEKFFDVLRPEEIHEDLKKIVKEIIEFCELK